MKFNLKQYQQIAVDNIKNKVYSFLLQNDSKKRIVTLKAPTGSGKTVVMAGLIENLIETNKENSIIDITFLWLSIGKGDLHNQSKRSLERIIGTSIKIQSIDEVFGTSQDILLQDSVLVSSWDKIRTREKNTHEWKNIVMKDGDNVNFREMLDNTNTLGRKIVLIIDESHSHTETERAGEIIDLIQPNVIIEVSATPNIKVDSAVEFYKEEIQAQDVIDEQMIKDQILVNSDFILLKKDDSDQTVLRTAIKKRDELEKIYKENGIAVNPLLLIQLPNSRDGESVKQMVLDFLKKEKAIEEDDDRLAIWLDSVEVKNRNIENISKNSSPQQFLIFKQVIDTGWDCPRAQILLKFREVQSEIFEIQVLGRILRMPEQKHYQIEALNKAYVYVNSDNISFDIEHYNNRILGDQLSVRQDKYEKLSLSSFYKERADYQDIKGDFKSILIESFLDELGLKPGSSIANIKTLTKNGWEFKKENLYHGVLSDISLKIESIDDYSVPLEDDNYETLNVSDRQVEIISKNIFIKMMAPFTNIARSVPTMNVAWFLLCENLFDSEMDQDGFLSSQVILVLNKPRIEPIFLRAVAKYSQVRRQKAKIDTEHTIEGFEIPTKDYFNSKTTEEVEYKKHILQPCYLDKNRSEPEVEFEKKLNSSKDVKWWYKNGEMRKDYFGIKYEFDNLDGKDTTHTFYPDYIVQFMDGKIGIFETKSKEDRDVKTKPKAEALQKYIQKYNKKGNNLFGGIVIYKDNEWQINVADKYSTDKDWLGLSL